MSMKDFMSDPKRRIAVIFAASLLIVILAVALGKRPSDHPSAGNPTAVQTEAGKPETPDPKTDSKNIETKSTDTEPQSSNASAQGIEQQSSNASAQDKEPQNSNASAGQKNGRSSSSNETDQKEEDDVRIEADSEGSTIVVMPAEDIAPTGNIDTPKEQNDNANEGTSPEETQKEEESDQEGVQLPVILF